MAKNITLMGANYPDVPAVDLPKTGGGTARFIDEDTMNSYIHVETVQAASAVTVPAGGYIADGRVAVPAVSGYTPICVIPRNSAGIRVCINACELLETKTAIAYNLINTTTAGDQSAQPIFDVLYTKSSA